MVLLLKFTGAHDITGTLNCSCILYLTVTLTGAHYITGALNCSCFRFDIDTYGHMILQAHSIVVVQAHLFTGYVLNASLLVYYVLNALSLKAH